MTWPADSRVPDSPFELFGPWYDAALSSDCHEPTAMSVSTVGAKGRPSCRMVLLKQHDEGGFRFATNYRSRKGSELKAHDQACLLFYWGALDRQIRVEGRVDIAPEAESDAIFARRPRGSQLGAWASEQSRPLGAREELTAAVDRFARRFENEVPRPPHWGAYILRPDYFEFWKGRDDRLHQRLAYRLDSGRWVSGLLAP